MAFSLLSVLLWVIGLVFLTYLVPHVALAWMCRPQDLKQKYNAKWALVTGASSGIGLAIVKRLAQQGLNVLMVALDDDVLRKAVAEVRKESPDVEIRAVGVDLGSREKGLITLDGGYLSRVRKELDRLNEPVQIGFLNAGYMLTGFFAETPLEKQLANLECNATSAVAISHTLADRMLDANVRGCLVFTSSAAANMPSPFSVLYAATKSFLSSFGASLAAELRPQGIDVLVIHPSPVASSFYDKAHDLAALDFFKRFAVTPETLPDEVFASIGRAVFRDIGAIAVIFRLVPKLIDYGFLAFVISIVGGWMPDFRKQARDAKIAREARRAKSS